MAQESAQHHGHDGAALQSLGGSVSQEDGDEVEDDVAGGVQDDVGAVCGIKAGHLGECCQQALDQAGSRNGGHQRGENFGQLLQDEVAHALLLLGNGLFLRRGRSGLTAQLGDDGVVNFGHFCAADHLELAAGHNDRDDALQMLDDFLFGFALVAEHKAQTGEAVSDLLHVGLAADIVQNVFGYLVVIHVFSPSTCVERFGPCTEKRTF